MGQQQLLFLIIGVIIVGIAIAVGITIVNAQTIATSRDSIINDLNHLASYAYQYKMRLRSMGGGGGEYTEFSIPLKLKSSEDAVYSVAQVQANSLKLLAVSSENSSNTVVATVGSDGKLQDWKWGGDFE